MHDQRKRHGNGQLRDTIRGIAFDIADGNAVGTAPGDIDIVKAGCGNTDQFQLVCGREIVRIQPAFVG